MNDKNENNKAREIEIKEVFCVLKRKKWWAVGIFIAVILGGFVYIFLRSPLYSISNKIHVVPDPSITGYENLAQYFPEKYNNLFEIELNLVLEDLKSDNFANLLKDRANIDIKEAESKNRFYLNIDQRMIVLSVISNDQDEVLSFDKELIDLFMDLNKTKLLNAYDQLIIAIDLKLTELKANIDILSEKIITGSSISLRNEFYLNHESYYKLVESKKVLTDNKDFFIDRFKVTNEPDSSNVLSYYNKKRDVIFVVFFAIAIALIGTFLINYIQGLRKKD